MKIIRQNLLVLVLSLLILALVACDGDNNQTNNGADTTPLATDVADVGEIEPEATAMVTEEVDLEATEVMTEVATIEPTEAMTPTVEAAATEEMTPTVEATETAVMTTTDEITETVTMTDTDVMTDTITQAILASDLVGMDITNAEGEEVGEVAELLIEEDGSVQYAIFDVGGFLGIGEKSVAVAWEDMAIQLEDGVEFVEGDEISSNDLTVRYTGAAVDLESLPEFDMGILDENGYVVDEDADTTDEFDATPYTGMLEVGEFQDYNLVNTANEDIGEVEDLIIDLSEGQVAYGVVDFGGFLGIAENSVAVPWDQMQLNDTGDDEIFMLDVTQADLEEAPLFDLNAWQYPVDADWDADDQVFWHNQ